ncbi:MAG: hypothetical protein LIP23_00030 [Planctomycetes bacterium]|nr:hypothetical protein [Planctomycetota bacterium]
MRQLFLLCAAALFLTIAPVWAGEGEAPHNHEGEEEIIEGVETVEMPGGPRSVAIYVMVAGGLEVKPARVHALVNETVSRGFAQQAEDKLISVDTVDPDNEANKPWMDFFEAKAGDVIVAQMAGDSIMESVLLNSPSRNQERGFVADLVAAIRKALQ